MDENALINTNEVTYKWFNYIFKSGEKPDILKDKINYQVMGADEWFSAPTIANMSNDSLKLYLTNVKKMTFIRSQQIEKTQMNTLSRLLIF